MALVSTLCYCFLVFDVSYFGLGKKSCLNMIKYVKIARVTGHVLVSYRLLWLFFLTTVDLDLSAIYCLQIGQLVDGFFFVGVVSY